MPAHKEWWEWLVLALGSIGGLKAMHDLTQSVMFSKPKLRGEVLDKRWVARISDALDGSDDRQLLVFLSVSNRHTQKTSVGRWSVELELADGSTKTVESTDYSADFWDNFMLEYRPIDAKPLDRDSVFAQNEIYKGWLRFPVSIFVDAKKLKIVAHDARGKEHVVARALTPAD